MKLKVNWEIPYLCGNTIVDTDTDLGISEEEWNDLNEMEQLEALDQYAVEDLDLISFADMISWELIKDE
jgi:hypothetical protein